MSVFVVKPNMKDKTIELYWNHDGKCLTVSLDSLDATELSIAIDNAVDQIEDHLYINDDSPECYIVDDNNEGMPRGYYSEEEIQDAEMNV